MKKPKLKLNHLPSRALILIVLVIFISTSIFFLYRPSAKAQIFLTSGTSWTVPSDWNSTNNMIEVIGGGGGGGGGYQLAAQTGGNGGGAGGAGGYARIVNASLVAGNTVTYAVGGAGAGGASSANGTAGGDTYLCSRTTDCSSVTGSAVIVGATGGGLGVGGTSLAAGGGGTNGSGITGTVTFAGGSGGAGGLPTASTGGGGGGGGGAGGPNNSGSNGAAASLNLSGIGGQGDGGNGGVSGGADGGAGGNGSEYDSTHGSGGGGGGGNGAKAAAGDPGGNGGTYGAGGGGGGGNGKSNQPGGSGGNGQQGLIRITYTRVVQSDYRWRNDDGNETTGTSLASQDSPANIVGTNAVRLRFLVTNSGETTTYNFRLEYTPYINGCGNWITVPTTATIQAFNMITTSNYTNGTASTNVTSGPGAITDPSGYSFTPGVLVSGASNSATVTLNGGQFTEIEYAFQPNSNASNPAYCFRITNAGTPLDSYANYPILNINYPPSAPTIYSVKDGNTNTSRLPVYQLRSYDYNGDYLKYQVELCLANSWPCSSGAQTYTTSDSCWSGYNANGNTAYSSGTSEPASQLAVCTTPVDSSHILAPSTTYYMRAEAIDPGGSNTYGPYSSVQSFTTGSLDIQINGGASIKGGTKIGG